MMNDYSKNIVAAFIRTNRAAIIKQANKVLVPHRFEIEDVIQYISLRLLERLKVSDPYKIVADPVKYFSGCIPMYCRDYRRETGYITSLPTRPDPKYLEEEDDIINSSYFYLSSSSNTYESKEAIKEEKLPLEIRKALLSLPPLERKIIILDVIREVPKDIICEELGITKTLLWKVKKRALAKLKLVIKK